MPINDIRTSRKILKVQGAILLGLGLLAIASGQALPEVASGSWTRLLGGFIAALGSLELAWAAVRDEASFWKGLVWICGAHLLLLLAVGAQRPWVEGGSMADFVLYGLFASFLTVAYAVDRSWALLARPPAITIQPLFKSSSHLQERYREQTREAAAQEERNRLARDLHDSVKQQIFAIQVSAAAADTRIESDSAGARQALSQVRDAAKEAMAEMEAMLEQLKAAPLEPSGLVAAIRRQCEATEHRSGTRVEFTPGALPAGDELTPGATQALFRVAQEALANVARHARAKHVQVGLELVGGALELNVIDDGAGFDVETKVTGMGLANLRVRAAETGGQFELFSSPGKGTRVRFVVPVFRRNPGELEAHRNAFIVWGVMAAFWCLLAAQGVSRQMHGIFAILSFVTSFREWHAWHALRRQGRPSA